MSSKGLDKSAATVQVKSRVHALKVYLGDKDTNLQLGRREAMMLARNLTMLSLDPEVKGYIIVRVQPGRQGKTKYIRPQIQVLGRKKKYKGQSR
jgi:hypothetical protein